MNDKKINFSSYADEYTSDIISLCIERRGVEQNVTYLDNTRVMIQFQLPLNEVIVDFHDRLKTITSGYASFDYEPKGYIASDLVKVCTIEISDNSFQLFNSSTQQQDFLPFIFAVRVFLPVSILVP